MRRPSPAPEAPGPGSVPGTTQVPGPPYVGETAAHPAATAPDVRPDSDGRSEALTADSPVDVAAEATGDQRTSIPPADQSAAVRVEAVARASNDPSRPTAPWLLRAAAGWSSRILVVALAVVLLLRLLAELKVLALAVIAALLLTALLHPLFRLFQRARLPRAAAGALTVLTLLAFLLLALGFVGTSTVSQASELQSSVGQGVDQIRNWLVTGPLHMRASSLDNYQASLSKQLSSNRDKLTSGAIAGATTAVEVLTGALLTLFCTFFFLFEGPAIWAWIVRLFSASVRDRIDGAGAVAWATVTGYIRGTVIVAAVDACSIGVGLFLVGVPLVLPLVLLTFIAAFIPIAGATLAGIACVLVALVSKGFVAALIVLAVVILVQQVEGHLLQPLLLGHSVRLHPLAIVLSIAGGATIAGIPGAVVAVPAVAVISRVGSYFVGLRAGQEPPNPMRTSGSVPVARA